MTLGELSFKYKKFKQSLKFWRDDKKQNHYLYQILAGSISPETFPQFKEAYTQIQLIELLENGGYLQRGISIAELEKLLPQHDKEVIIKSLVELVEIKGKIEAIEYIKPKKLPTFTGDHISLVKGDNGLNQLHYFKQ